MADFMEAETRHQWVPDFLSHSQESDIPFQALLSNIANSGIQYSTSLLAEQKNDKSIAGLEVS